VLVENFGPASWIARFRLPGDKQGQSSPDLLLIVRLWTYRSLQARRGFDLVAQAMSGIIELYRREAGRTAGKMRRAAVRYSQPAFSQPRAFSQPMPTA